MPPKKLAFYFDCGIIQECQDFGNQNKETAMPEEKQFDLGGKEIWGEPTDLWTTHKDKVPPEYDIQPPTN